MNIHVLFFGATADIAGERRIDIEMPPETVASAVFEKLFAEHPQLASHKLHVSLNQQYATGNELLSEGDELAIFTAVSGG
ncbi:MAG: MoaD/ThiS family protein [Chloracidobacterium sp.]|nr:MoaD/ThiS family protein [Chloracidobacterium sp.]